MRNCLFDNAKGLLIILVVVGHLLENAIHANVMIKSIYISIYLFHMPAFALISGIFSKTEASDVNLHHSVKNLIIPFIAFEGLYEVCAWLHHGHPSPYLLGLQPHWILWYLLSLFCWRVLAPIVNQLKFATPLSIIFALTASYFEDIDYFLGLSRTIVIFPFFLAGLNLREKFLKIKPQREVRFVAGMIFLGVPVLFYFLPSIRPEWFYASLPYTLFQLEGVTPALYRLQTYLGACALILALLCVSPERETFLGKLGRNSMYVYLWHGFAIKIVSSQGFLVRLAKTNLCLFWWLVLLMTGALVILLSREGVKKFTHQLLFTPLENILLRRDGR